MRSLFIFRQDLRVFDNVGLRHAIQESREVVPVFIFDTQIIEGFPQQDKRLGFLQQAVENLDKELQTLGSRLYVHYGNSKELIPQLIKTYGCDALYVNSSYGDSSISRDGFVRQRCREQGIVYKQFSDFLLIEPEDIRPYKVYTPFYNVWIKQVVEKYTDYKTLKVTSCKTPVFEHDNSFSYKQLNAGVCIMRDAGAYQDRLDQFAFDKYEETRNTPSIDGSSKLSPYIRFGIISVRQLFIQLYSQGKASAEQEKISLRTYIKELARREFWHHIAYHFPLSRESEFQEKRRFIKREQNDQRFQARAEGKTGYPLVDAGMRQLRQENRMHNRVRMVVASFLCKDLLIDWRLGEKEFERYLLDYDANVNRGNRQWSASVGADPKPLRIFNPMLQSQRFDPDCLYIKHYIPQLQDYTPEQIHNPLEHSLGYATPLVNHFEYSKLAKQRYNDSNSYYQETFMSDT